MSKPTPITLVPGNPPAPFNSYFELWSYINALPDSKTFYQNTVLAIQLDPSRPMFQTLLKPHDVKAMAFDELVQFLPPEHWRLEKILYMARSALYGENTDQAKDDIDNMMNIVLLMAKIRL